MTVNKQYNYTGCIYLATNKVNGKQYVGKTVRSLCARRLSHVVRAKKGSMTAFHRALLKHGIDAFDWEVLIEEDVERLLNRWERFYIKRFGTKSPHGYNLTDGGEGMSGYVHSKESKTKIGAAQLGKIVSLETRAKIHFANLGRVLSTETRARIGDAQLGKIVSLETRRKMGLGNKGKVITQNQRRQISQALKRYYKDRLGPMAGKQHSLLSRIKMKASHVGEPGPMTGKKHTLKTRAKLRAAWVHRKVKMKEKCYAKNER